MTKSPDITPELQIEINRRLWIEALRENEYRQCKQGWTHGNHGVCALGVALELGRFPIFYGQRFNNSHRWLGIKFVGARFSDIAKDNDRGWTFIQIADAAEQGRYW